MRAAPRAVAVAAALLASALPLGAAPKPRPAEASAEYLYGVPAGLALEKLVDRPVMVGSVNYVFEDAASGERRLGGYAEVVAVYDIPLAELAAVSLDFESYPSFVPRIFETRILRRDGDSYRLFYNAGIRFLGIDVTYDSEFESVVDRLPDGGVGIRAWLAESLDESEFEHFTSFYFHPVTVGGKAMTFVRYFNRPGIRRPSAGMLQVLNAFTAPEARGQVAAIAREALRRWKAR